MEKQPKKDNDSSQGVVFIKCVCGNKYAIRRDYSDRFLIGNMLSGKKHIIYFCTNCVAGKDL